MSDADLVVWQEGHAGRLRLNRPDALNALTHEMALGIERALIDWREDDSVSAVIIDATGERAFCAGGDIQALYHSGLKDPEPGRVFWRDEYRLNAMIASYPKPYVSFMNGITMGGGVGVSAHGSHRIVTENTMLAMPEVSIGFLPDVGGTWILSRAPGETGLYLGMTGTRMNAADAIFAGFADSYVPAERLDAVAALLAEGKSADEAIATHADTPEEGALAGTQEKISDAFGKPTALACVERLEEMAGAGDDWAKEALKMISRNAPRSVAAAFTAIHAARKLSSLEECLALEYRFAHRSLLPEAEFLEGIRAMVIDKDRAPQWRPPSLAQVTQEMVDTMLAPLGAQEWKPA